MSFSEIKAGVVGIGFIGVAHIEALRRLGVRVVGVVGSTPERATAKAASANLPKVYESVEAMVADPKIDVVHVASPNHVHADQVREALAAGKHVVCEKPLALTSEDTADLVERAAVSGLVNAVCFNIRFYPLNHQMAAMVRDGSIGRPTFVTGSYLQDWLLLETDWNWRLVAEEAGALRAVADIGSHWLDLARFITGRRVIEVMADLHTFVPVRRHPAGPVETFASAGDSDELTFVNNHFTAQQHRFDRASHFGSFEDRVVEVHVVGRCRQHMRGRGVVDDDVGVGSRRNRSLARVEP